MTNIAIIGFGVVGSGVYELIKDLNEFSVKYILVKNEDLSKNPLFIDDFNIILDDESISIIVEATNVIDQSCHYIKEGLLAKKNIVSANKALIQKNYLEFQELAKKSGVAFKYEAAVAGGIPIIHNLIRAKNVDEITQFKGIVNGTSNYILDKMTSENLDFQEALNFAIQKGYAEKNSHDDIYGIDSANKLRIITNILTNDFMTKDFLTFGINNLEKSDIEYFKSKNQTIKLVASYFKFENSYNIFVMPESFDDSHIFTNINTNLNITEYQTKSLGKLQLIGQGAGSLPTANSILLDILDIKNNFIPDYYNYQKDIFTFDNFSQKFNFILRIKEIPFSLKSYEYEKYNDLFYLKIDQVSINKLNHILKNFNVDTPYFIVKMAGDTK